MACFQGFLKMPSNFIQLKIKGMKIDSKKTQIRIIVRQSVRTNENFRYGFALVFAWAHEQPISTYFHLKYKLLGNALTRGWC